MYFILKGHDCQFYILPFTTHLVGRAEADILIINKSISHKHAIFVVTNDEVTVADLFSRSGTFVNETKLKPSDPHKLNDGDTIKFGHESSFRFQKVEIMNTTSGINLCRKWELSNIMDSMGGLLLEYWSWQCNYVTVDQFSFTLKVLSAVIVGTPIVNMQYWNDYLQCVKSNEPLPDPVRYFPKDSKALISENVSLEYKEERKTVFKNKIFLFTNRQDKEKMEPLIKLAGGHAQFWDEEPLDVIKLLTSKSEYILMHATDLNDTMQQDKRLAKFVESYFGLEIRAIPCSEIVSGILYCTCKEYCNPTFIRGSKGIQQTTNTNEI